MSFKIDEKLNKEKRIEEQQKKKFVQDSIILKSKQTTKFINYKLICKPGQKFLIRTLTNQHIIMWKQVFQDVKEFRIKTIHIQVNQEILKLKVVRHLPNVKMFNVKVLVLTNCNLSSVEFIHLCDLSNLEHLNLMNNKITNIQTLNKCFFNKPIQYLQLHVNPITSLTKNQIVRRINFKIQNKLHRFDINWYIVLAKFDNSPSIIQDYVYCLPFQVKQIQFYGMNYRKQIIQHKFRKMVTQKIYQNVKYNDLT